MIVVPLVLAEEPVSLAELERQIQRWGQTVMQEALVTAWAAQAPPRPIPPCPRCAATISQPAGHRARVVETSFGAVRLPRQRRCCAGCGRHFQPDDALRAPVLGAGRLSPRLRELAALCGTSWPYRQAATVLGYLRGTPVSPETVRTVVGTVGQAVAQTLATEGAAAVATPARTTDPRRPVPAELVVEPVPAELVVEVDGAWIHGHDNRQGLEVKVGVVHTGSEVVGLTRRRLRSRRLTAAAAGSQLFGQRLTAAIESLNGFAAPTQTFLGDGASWIWRLGDDDLPAATKVLDRWHLHEARRRALRATLPAKIQRASWSARLEDRLDVGDVPGAPAVLRELAAETPHPALTEFAGYLTALASRIPNYAERRTRGERVGSGAIEKGVDLVASRRLNGRRGMRWRRDRVEGGVALRLVLLNDEWSHYVPTTLPHPKLPTF